MYEVTVKIHSIAEDGLPDMDDENMVGRVAFIWDGCIVSGWPLTQIGRSADHWEPAEDRFGGPVTGVTHWVEFPEPVWRYERPGHRKE